MYIYIYNALLFNSSIVVILDTFISRTLGLCLCCKGIIVLLNLLFYLTSKKSSPRSA